MNKHFAATVLSLLLLLPLAARAGSFAETDATDVAVKAMRANRLPFPKDPCWTEKLVKDTPVFYDLDFFEDHHSASCGDDAESKPELFEVRVIKENHVVNIVDPKDGSSVPIKKYAKDLERSYMEDGKDFAQ